jgi:hypothetical protein
MQQDMWMARITVLFGLSILLATACAGRDFPRPSTESLILGKTTKHQIIQQLGAPERVGTKLVNEQQLDTMVYAFASLGRRPLVEGVTPARAMGLYFLNGLLVGHEFTSSYMNDHTDFDEARARFIRKGETSREQVIEMLGAPHGQYAWPLVRAQGDRGIVYVYSHVKDGLAPRLYEKILVVSVDSNGVVTDVDFRSSGQR